MRTTRHTTPIARTARRCDELCGHVIQPGEQYSRCDGVRDGEWCSWARCVSCAGWFDAFAALGADVLSMDEPDEARALFDTLLGVHLGLSFYVLILR